RRPRGEDGDDAGGKGLSCHGLATELLKLTVREKRPNSDSRTSFPSGHTAAAFAMATVIADYHPRFAIPAYLSAVTIAWSREEVGAHYWQDLVAGAALGYFIGKHFTSDHFSVGASGLSWKW
ncbi:MAG: phosphatase PAP2 family protein, partial [Armatimonadota bacterium]|nr:phosphatase PAP2 family protein [Armatimonadota bacterium]